MNLGELNGTATRYRYWKRRAEGEGFEPSTDPEARNGFRDRRIRPLCHPSEPAQGSGPGEPVLCAAHGEVAEWLKAAPC
jgi:hypothetical protein